MKSVFYFFLFSLLTPMSFAFADYCDAQLTRNQRHVETFSGWGYSRREACREALRTCQKELREYQRRSPFANFKCSTNTDPGRGYQSCTYTLKSYRNRVINRFTVRGNDYRRACLRAKNRCEVASRRHRNGSRCVKELRRFPPRRGQVTRSCTVERVRGHRVIQTHFASAVGQRPRQVEQRACNKALEQCQRASRIGERCRRRR